MASLNKRKEQGRGKTAPITLYPPSGTYLTLIGPGWTPFIATHCMHTDDAAKTSAAHATVYSFSNPFLIDAAES